MWPGSGAANLSRVLAERPIDPPVTANRSERRSAARKRRVPLALLAAPVALVTVGVVLILVLGGGNNGVLGLGGGDDEPDDSVPEFEFKLASVDAVPTVAEADVDALQSQAESVAANVEPLVDDLFTNAFLDPTNWREGDYEEILESFSDDAASSARSAESLGTLTLGSTAGEVYQRVTPRKGSLRLTVLFDQEGAPDTVNVRVRFYALGERLDGTFTSIVSAGQLSLQDLDGWRIVHFDVRRADREAEAPSPSPGPSGSATVSPS